jgi:hypothetical protein
MSLTNQKIRIATSDISRAIQEDLFQQGYEWRSVGKNVQHATAAFLYAKEDGRLSYGQDRTLFEEKEYPEVIYTTQTKLVVVEKKPVRAKVVLFGKTYYKDELDAALSSLRTAI